MVSRGYTFGTRDGIFEFEERSLGVLICFEVAIDDIGRELVSDGAEIILSQTNNADFGRSDETFQQAALARLRAIETGRTLVNISTVGVSKVFLADGSIVDELPIFEPGIMVHTLPLRTSITPAMVIGPGFDLAINVFALSLLTGAIGSWVRGRSKKSNV
jgi:apolipoprotein N-acyltransferase